MSSLDLADLHFLASDFGTRILDRLARQDLSESQTLPLLTTLRRDLTPEQASASLTMARLRQKAVDKFGDDAARMFFTPVALQQASDPLARCYRAQFIAAGGSVVDACCGIGADSLAMARAGSHVLGLDIDPVRVAIARYNAAALDIDARFDVADVCDGLPSSDAIFYDPARRDENDRRIDDVERYRPPLSLVCDWSAAQIAVKLSPSVERTQLRDYGGSVEFISVAGDLKEAVLWLHDGVGSTRATLLTGENVYHWQRVDTPDVSLSWPRGWLVEPDPALLRAGLVQDVAAAFDGALLDHTIAYFTTDQRPQSPWLRAWEVLDWMPFNLKRLRAHLREHGVGHITVKKRGFPMTPGELTARLKLKGDVARTLILTRCMGRPVVIVCGRR